MQATIELQTSNPRSTDIALEPDQFAAIADGVEKQGYVVLPAAVPENLCGSLLNYLAELEQGEFHPAGVGRGVEAARNPLVRLDHIHWIGEEHPASEQWLAWAKRLRLYLNERLYLGLFSFESHFSLYREGDYYRRHVDAFKGESNRVLSLVVYLNKNWKPGLGGELRIFCPANNTEIVRVAPEYGSLVLFLSEEFPHEVLPTQCDRYAVAGWFRLNTSVNNTIDPPR